MSKKLFLTICLLATTFFMASAQPTWQWGKRGGSSDAGSGGVDETVVDMATDQHGNVYVLSSVLQTGINVDGHAVAEWGGYDVLVSSFKCDGTYRWSKTIGGSGDDHSFALRTDTLGGVYVTGYLATHFITVHVDADTSWGTGTSYKSFFLMKFDTAGAYKWFRMPQPDTAGLFAFSYTAALDMDVDGGGNIYMLCSLYPGAYAGGAYIVSSTSYHILAYDRNGNFLSGNQIQISAPTSTGNIPYFKMKKDFHNGRYYITGTIPVTSSFSFGTSLVSHPLYLGSFNSSGTLLWQKQNTSTTTTEGFGRASVDQAGNVYVAGGSNYFTINDTFNGYTVINTIHPYGEVPLVVKLDSNGNNIWAINASANSATFCQTVILNGSELDIAGEYPGRLKWLGYSDSLNLASGSLYHIFITRFDASTGSVIKMDSLANTPGYYNDATAMAVDKLGNFFVGGDFGDDLTVNGTTLLSAGGGSDFFIAKYGISNCNLATLETSSLPLPTTKTLVYPNPVTDELTIENASAGAIIKLFSIMGQQVYDGIVSNDKQVINTKYLAAGTYLLQLTDKNGNRTTKTIVKQ